MIRRRLQLSLIHMAVAMTLVPINSTLNRIMINELAVPATIVALLASLPYLFSPLQVMIGSFSDRHPVFGLRRTPYILLGLMLCVSGVVVAPYVVFFMQTQPVVGWLLTCLAFGLWGMGFNFATVAYLSLASEVSGEKGRSGTISVMWFAMILGIIATSITLSALLENYSHETLQAAFGWVGGLSLALGLLGLLGLESRSGSEAAPAQRSRTGWGQTMRAVYANPQARWFFGYLIILLAAILGQDVLLEPYAAQAFGLPVAVTSRITSYWGGTFLLALFPAGWLERRWGKRRVARVGGWGAALALLLIAASGPLNLTSLFYTGVFLLGFMTGLSTVSNLSLMLDMTTTQVGLFIGAWGMADALARLVGALLGGALRDVVMHLSQSPVIGYVFVFVVEAIFLAVSIYMLQRIDVGQFRQQAAQLSVTERAALLNESSSG